MIPPDIKQARQSLGLTQALMAEMLGYADKARVSEIERGTRAIDAGRARLLQAYLDGYRPGDWPI